MATSEGTLHAETKPLDGKLRRQKPAEALPQALYAKRSTTGDITMMQPD